MLKLRTIPFIVAMTLGGISSTFAKDNLTDVYQLALTQDPQLLRAAASVNVSKQGITQAQSSLYPNLSLRLSAGQRRKWPSTFEVYVATHPVDLEAAQRSRVEYPSCGRTSLYARAHSVQKP